MPFLLKLFIANNLDKKSFLFFIPRKKIVDALTPDENILKNDFERDSTMGCDVTVYRLYKLANNNESLILAHAVWPACPGDSFNWWASDVLEERFRLLLI